MARNEFKQDKFRVENPFGNPKDYNQHLLNKLTHAHGFVMEHVLDDDREEQNSRYAGAALAREVIGREVVQAAVDFNKWEAAQHTCGPAAGDQKGRLELFRNRRAARNAA